MDLLNDAQNCGVCGRSCGGAACLDGACQPLVLADDQVWVGGLAVDGDHIYWTNRNPGPPMGQVMRASLDGGNRVELAGGQAMPGDIAVTPTALFWVNTSYTWQPMRMDRDGGVPQVLSTSSPLSSSGVLRLTATDVLWPASTGTGGVIYSVPHVGGARSTLVATPPNTWVVAMALDDSSVFWATQSEIWRASLQGQGATSLTQTQLLNGLVADDSWVYWLEETNPGVYLRRIPRTGGAPVTLLAEPTWRHSQEPHGMALDGPYVYFGYAGYPGRIVRVPRAGGPAVTIASPAGTTEDIVIDATHVYWTNFSQVLKTPK